MSHQVLDRVNADQDRRIAATLRRDPRRLRVARANLGRWIAADGRRVRPAVREWHAVLQRLTAREIAAFLCSETPWRVASASRVPWRESSVTPNAGPSAGVMKRRELELVLEDLD